MTRRLEFLLVAFVALAMAAASTLFYSSFSLNHDSSWYLVATARFLNGGKLYQDIVEINPPLAFYLTAPALLLARLTGLAATTAYILYVSSMGAVATVWVYWIARRSAMSEAERWLITGSAMVGFYLIIIRDFGQREHLMLIFAMPYLTYLIFADSLKSIGRVEQGALGLFAFLGLGLKPYFLLIPLAIIAANLVRTRRIGPVFNLANIALGAALLLYLGFIFAVHPDYINIIVPEAALVYGAFQADPMAVFWRLELIGFVLALVLALLCARDLDPPAWGMIAALIGSFASYAVQMKGWNYQIIHVAFFTFLAAVWILWRARQCLRQRPLPFVIALIAIAYSLGFQLAGGPYRAQTSEAFGKYVEREGTPVLVLSSNVSASFPFVNEARARWTSRYPAQWLLPGAVSLLAHKDCAKEARQCDKYRAIIADTRARMVEDFALGKPELVYVDDRKRKSYFHGTRFDYRRFLLADPRFARMWKRYHRIGRVKHYAVYRRSTTTR